MVNIEKAYLQKMKNLTEMKSKINTNYKFSHMYMQKQHEKLVQYRNNILAEKVQWENERDKLHNKLGGTFGSGIICLDVGGTHRIKTNANLLTSVRGSLLAKMFSGKHEVPTDDRGNIFLDRDGETFLTLINYLRNHRKELPKFDYIQQEELFLKELEFWELDEDYERMKKAMGVKSDKKYTP
mgnify:FL=1